MNFVDRITFDDLVGNVGVEGWIVPGRNEIVLQIEKDKITLIGIEKTIELRDKLTTVIKKFAEVTGTGFK